MTGDWLAILFTFALGTATGDLTAEKLGRGSAMAAIVLAVLIAVVAVAHRRFGLNGVLAFWVAYILTRSLGASLGDLLSRSRDDDGLGPGTVATSLVFLAIFGVVGCLAVSRRDAPHLNETRYRQVAGR